MTERGTVNAIGYQLLESLRLKAVMELVLHALAGREGPLDLGERDFHEITVPLVFRREELRLAAAELRRLKLVKGSDSDLQLSSKAMDYLVGRLKEQDVLFEHAFGFLPEGGTAGQRQLLRESLTALAHELYIEYVSAALDNASAALSLGRLTPVVRREVRFLADSSSETDMMTVERAALRFLADTDPRSFGLRCWLIQNVACSRMFGMHDDAIPLSRELVSGADVVLDPNMVIELAHPILPKHDPVRQLIGGLVTLRGRVAVFADSIGEVDAFVHKHEEGFPFLGSSQDKAVRRRLSAQLCAQFEDLRMVHGDHQAIVMTLAPFRAFLDAPRDFLESHGISYWTAGMKGRVRAASTERRLEENARQLGRVYHREKKVRKAPRSCTADSELIEESSQLSLSSRTILLTGDTTLGIAYREGALDLGGERPNFHIMTLAACLAVITPLALHPQRDNLAPNGWVRGQRRHALPMTRFFESEDVRQVAALENEVAAAKGEHLREATQLYIAEVLHGDPLGSPERNVLAQRFRHALRVTDFPAGRQEVRMLRKLVTLEKRLADLRRDIQSHERRLLREQKRTRGAREEVKEARAALAALRRANADLTLKLSERERELTAASATLSNERTLLQLRLRGGLVSVSFFSWAGSLAAVGVLGHSGSSSLTVVGLVGVSSVCNA